MINEVSADDSSSRYLLYATRKKSVNYEEQGFVKYTP